MTNEEALTLKPGDKVMIVARTKKYGSRSGEVQRVRQGSVGSDRWVSVRVRVKSASGRVRTVGEPPICLTFLSRPVRETAHVFADFLEERGELRAAALLREAFPMVPANVETR